MYQRPLLRSLPVVITLGAAFTTLGPVTPLASAQQTNGEQCVSSGTTSSASAVWPQDMLAAERVWPLATGAGQRVAIVGTGVADTPYLTGKIIARRDFAGQITNRDCLGIGTGVAGVITGQSPDGAGFRGISPEATVLAAKVVGDRFPADQPSSSVAADQIADAINWAVDQRATVIAVTTVTYQDSAGLATAVRRAQDSGAVVVASVEASDQAGTAESPSYPAAYDDVVGVAAIDATGTVTEQVPAGVVDLVAPGTDIITTYPGDGLGPASGSAFAAGYVAGAAALVREYRPELSALDVTNRLFLTATPGHEGAGSPRYGYGIVNPLRAVADQVVRGETAGLPGMPPSETSPEDQARAAGRADSNALAFQLAAVGAVLIAGAVVAIVLGPSGRRRRWRSGFASRPTEHPERERPEPPVELFADQHRTHQ
ncbi:S8 family serine peptidase [Saccharomonospora sp. NPDC046836]|uniref:S8 family serine peptidase n=1 Tax=Saccharomonospora sp. NPDC046836 TaxID=3156921 RepID=UPI0033FE8F19